MWHNVLNSVVGNTCAAQKIHFNSYIPKIRINLICVKPKLLTAILLFISAYSPLFVILAVKDFDFDETCNFKHPTAIYILLIFTAISLVLLFVSISQIKKGIAVKVEKVSNRSVDLINYTIPYILSFFGFDLSKPGDVISLTIFLLIMLLLTIRSKSVFLNPILALVGYGLYDLEYSFDGKREQRIIISKHELKTNEIYLIRSLTRFLYLTTEKIEQSNANENEV